MKKLTLISIIFMSMFLISFASAEWESSLDTDLISWWTLNETSGTSVKDLQGNFTGTASNDRIFTSAVDGILDSTSADFSGGSDKIDVEGLDDLVTGREIWTMSLWFNSSASGENTLFFSRSSAVSNWEVHSLYLLDGSIKSSRQSGDAGDVLSSVSSDYNDGEWHFVVFGYDGDNMFINIDNGTEDLSKANTYSQTTTIGPYFGRGRLDRPYDYSGVIDEVGIWSRALTSDEIEALYNNGEGTNPLPREIIDLLSPEDDEILTNNSVTFSTNVNLTTSLSIQNVSLLIDGVINETNSSGYEGVYNFSKTLGLGEHNWSIQAYDNESTLYKSETRDFAIGANLNSITYSTHTYETATETFSAEFDIVEDAEISQVILVYNGTNYPVSDITISSTNLSISKTMDIPKNINSLSNETKEFYWEFTYGGGGTQKTSTYEQNVSFINLQLCNATYSTTSLNFTITNEETLTSINASANPITFEAYFTYWLGSGDVTKNYSYQVINSTTKNNFSFCIHPYIPENYTFKANLDNAYSATDYSENNYYLRNATLTNQTGNFDLLLFLLDETTSTRFYVTIKQGITFIEDALVTISKFFIGSGEYKTVGIKLTDDNGEFPFYADMDGQYRWTIVQDGQTLGIIEKKATCLSTPCELEINLDEAITNIFEGYSDYYASNVQSTLVYDADTKLVTYTFVDTTGMAQYFRLVVNKVSFNQTRGNVICDKQSFSVAGSLTCNVTDYEGNFFAYGYISRSPEVIDKIIDFVIADAFSELGMMGLLLNIIIIITMIFASATISRGNPSTVVFVLGVTILLLKLGGLFPFSWIVVVSIEALLAYILTKLKV